MTPQVVLDAMYRAFNQAGAGQDIVLRRISGEPPNTTNNDITIRAAVRGAGLQELVGGIAQAVLRIVMSTVEITAENWPGDGSLPRRNDRVIINGQVFNITSVYILPVGNDFVRIELQVSG